MPPFLFVPFFATMAMSAEPVRLPIPPAGGAMKRNTEPNKLCSSCRRHCKQLATVVISSCPRYYPGPKIKRQNWTQLEFELLSTP